MIRIVIVCCDGYIFATLQIVDYDHSQSHKPRKLYDTKFSTYFPSGDNSDTEREGEKSCEPTIVCYNKRDSVLEVRTNKLTDKHSHCCISLATHLVHVGMQGTAH